MFTHRFDHAWISYWAIILTLMPSSHRPSTLET